MVITDTPVRSALVDGVHKLIPLIPDKIEGSTDRTAPENLRFLLDRCMDEAATMPVDKMGRFVGFVHGVLALSGHMDVDAMRDETREAYHEAYRLSGQAIPETKTLSPSDPEETESSDGD